ncbi:unnamed protein product [Boreogadus saida]
MPLCCTLRGVWSQDCFSFFGRLYPGWIGILAFWERQNQRRPNGVLYKHPSGGLLAVDRIAHTHWQERSVVCRGGEKSNRPHRHNNKGLVDLGLLEGNG